jgi:starvation-inducible DNA-binding protein
MSTTNAIGLDIQKSKKEAELLNELLANLSIFYMNTRGYHWNIKGDKFFELHVKFEELYDDLKLKIDEVAERIVTLGEVPFHTYEDYMRISAIQPSKNVFDPYIAVDEILASFKTVLEKERALLDLSDEVNDEGTNALMSDYITEQEKTVWMYSAFRNKA